MFAVLVFSLLVGSLGLQATAVSGWLRWQQILTKQRSEEEEEILTRYESKETPITAAVPVQAAMQRSPNGAVEKSSLDLRQVGWEFKIVRASRDLFRNPAILQQLCDEEAQAGWILLEKLDDRRIRFKRPIALRETIQSEQLSYDPYRSHYGSSFHPFAWVGAVAFLVVLLLPAYLAFILVSRQTDQTPSYPATAPMSDRPTTPDSISPSTP